jgi:F-type H+-transporting ATPase subunit b
VSRMKPARILLLSAALVIASPVAVMAQSHPAAHHESTPADSPSHASPSVMSGQSSEPDAVPGPEKENAEGGTEAFKKSPSVIKLGGMLGMKPALASSVFEWLNFIVLAAAVLYGLAKSLPKAFRGRTETIQKDIVEARVATEEARTRLGAVEDRLGRLDAEIAALRSENEKAAAEEEARIHAHVEEEKKRILAAAEQEIAAASNAATRSLRAYAAEIAVDLAAKNLQISPDDDRVLIESFAGKLQAEGSRN